MSCRESKTLIWTQVMDDHPTCCASEGHENEGYDPCPNCGEAVVACVRDKSYYNNKFGTLSVLIDGTHVNPNWYLELV